MFLKEYLRHNNFPTDQDIIEAEAFLSAHGEPFNKKGFTDLIALGYWPVNIQAVAEGTVVPTSNVLVQIENTHPDFFWLPSFLETSLLRGVWYPTTVCTLSWMIRQLIQDYMNTTSDDPSQIDFKLHDFGARGASSFETASIGGCAHLINFKGTDTMSGILAARKYYNEDMAGFSIPACYDSQTEILTDIGFKLFNDLTDNDMVAQYDNGNIMFVNPINIYKDRYVGEMIHFYTKSKQGKVDLLVTPNHRMVRKSIATGKIEIQEANVAKFSHRNLWLQGGQIKSGFHKNGLSMMERLKIAFQADGSFPSRKDAYNGNRTGKIPIRFSLKKERKKERLRWILNSLEVEYTESKSNRPGYVSFWIKLDEELSKTFDWIEFNTLSLNWCREFIEECSLWDGIKLKSGGTRYCSTIKFNSDVVQTVGCLSGYRSTINTYFDKRNNRKETYEVILTINPFREGKGIYKEILDYNGNIYCVSVPSGMIVVRRNGIISISGNSEHSTITSWGGREGEIDSFKNMLNQFAKPGRMVAVVSDSYDIMHAIKEYWGKRLKKRIIDSGATLVVRPDSGNPVTIVRDVIKELMNSFGYETNNKGYDVLPPYVRVIQGDGVEYDSIRDILVEITNCKLSTDNIAFGMGGALLQNLNRDFLKFAMKTSAIYINGKWIDVYKDPITDHGKKSKKGHLALCKDMNGDFKTIRADEAKVFDMENHLVTVYNNGRLLKDYTFNEIRERAKRG
jgi:nicotinic acid phosphoribosyltransferase